MKLATYMFCMVFCLSSVSLAAEVGFTQKDRELLIRLDERLNQVDKRFEQIELRISELREDMNKRFEFMLQMMMAIVGAFAAIVAVSIGFAIWDRRTMIRPFETKVKEVEKEILEDKNRFKKLIEALRQLAKDDQKLATVLKSFALL